MVVFGIREGINAVFISNGDSKLFGIFPDIPDVKEKGVTFAFPDIREDEIPTITLPASIAQELYAAGRLKFEK